GFPFQLQPQTGLEVVTGKIAQLLRYIQQFFQLRPVVSSGIWLAEQLIDGVIEFVIHRKVIHGCSSLVLVILLRSVSSARNCSCLTAPSDRPSSCAISRMLFWSTKRRMMTRRWSAGSRSTS